MKAAEREAQLMGIIATQAGTIAALTGQLAAAGLTPSAGPLAPPAPDPALSTLADPDVESAIAHYSWGDKAIEQRNRALASRLAREGKAAGEIAKRIARGGERRTTGDDE